MSDSPTDREPNTAIFLFLRALDIPDDEVKKEREKGGVKAEKECLTLDSRIGQRDYAYYRLNPCCYIHCRNPYRTLPLPYRNRLVSIH